MRHPRGFTLIELMIVVVIVSVLAMLAVLGYRKIVNSSHVSEATTMVNNIRLAQEAYHAETQTYANCSPDLTSKTSWYPAASSYTILTPWGAACTQCNAGYDMSTLPVHVDGPLLFGYATIAGTASTTQKTITTNCGTDNTLKNPVIDWFAVAAEADLDGNPANTTDVCAFSWTNQILVYNEGL
jgi:type IV pilus assembly protein PilA